MTSEQPYLQDPTAVANPEQTASILRWIFWSFLDPVVWRAYRLPHLSHDQLPPLADYDEAHYLTEKHYEVRGAVFRMENHCLSLCPRFSIRLRERRTVAWSAQSSRWFAYLYWFKAFASFSRCVPDRVGVSLVAERTLLDPPGGSQPGWREQTS